MSHLICSSCSIQATWDRGKKARPSFAHWASVSTSVKWGGGIIPVVPSSSTAQQLQSYKMTVLFLKSCLPSSSRRQRQGIWKIPSLSYDVSPWRRWLPSGCNRWCRGPELNLDKNQLGAKNITSFPDRLYPSSWEEKQGTGCLATGSGLGWVWAQASAGNSLTWTARAKAVSWESCGRLGGFGQQRVQVGEKVAGPLSNPHCP